MAKTLKNVDTSAIAERVFSLDQQQAWPIADELVRGIPAGQPDEDGLLAAVHQALIELGSERSLATIKAWRRAAIDNPPQVRHGISITAAQEARQHPQRFEWFAAYGPKLTKRMVRGWMGGRLDTSSGSRKASTADHATSARRSLDALPVEHREALLQEYRANALDTRGGPSTRDLADITNPQEAAHHRVTQALSFMRQGVNALNSAHRLLTELDGPDVLGPVAADQLGRYNDRVAELATAIASWRTTGSIADQAMDYLDAQGGQS